MKRLVLIVLLMICCLAPIGQSAGQQPTPTGFTFRMEWSPDGSVIAIASFDGAWLYWNQEYYQITSGEIDDITWSNDGTSIALLNRSSIENQIEIWNISPPNTPTLIHRITDTNLRPETIENLDWSPISNQIAVSGIGIRIWNADTGDLVRTIQPTAFSRNVQWSPDGNSVANFAYSLNIWDSTGVLQYEVDFPLAINTGSWGNDCQHIAVVQTAPGTPSEVYILDLTQADFSPIVLSHNGLMSILDWKGNTLAGYVNPNIAIWDLRTQQSLPIVPSGYADFALSKNGSQIAYIQDGVLQIQTINTPVVAPTPNSTPD